MEAGAEMTGLQAGEREECQAHPLPEKSKEGFLPRVFNGA